MDKLPTLVVQVSTERDDHFVSIDEGKLREIASRLPHTPLNEADPALLKSMREDFWKAASSVQISRTSECDVELVLDGEEDQASWRDLIDTLDGFNETPSVEN